MNNINYNFEELLNKYHGNITNKHVTKNLDKTSDSNLQKPYFFVEGSKIYNSDKNTNFKIGLKYGYQANYKNINDKNDSNNTLIKAKKVLPQLSSYWEIKSYHDHLKNVPNQLLKSNKLSLLSKSDVNKFRSKNIQFNVPVTSKLWKKIRGGYIFKLGTSMYFLPGSHFKSKKSLLKYKKVFEKTINLPSHFSLLGNRVPTVILQSKKNSISKTSFKLNDRVIFKNLKQVSKKSKYIVSQKELKKLTATDNLKAPLNWYNNSYYGKHLTA
jgi:hypothetical protein